MKKSKLPKFKFWNYVENKLPETKFRNSDMIDFWNLNFGTI